MEPQVCARCFWTMDKQLTYSLQVVIHACTPANINKVEDLALSSEDKPRKQFTIKKIA